MKSALSRVAAARESFERVADVVGELDHFVALVVVAENDNALAEGGLGGSDPGIELVVRQTEKPLRQRLPLADALLLEVREDFDIQIPKTYDARCGLNGPLDTETTSLMPSRRQPRQRPRGR